MAGNQYSRITRSMRKGREIILRGLGGYGFDGKYHLADQGGRGYLCPCGRELHLHERLKINIGYRQLHHAPLRNSYYLLQL